MDAPAAGDVVLIPFPFSDLSQSKLRPAVCLAPVGRGDCILCQITTKAYGDASAISISDSDFTVGSLRVPSVVRPGKLFTAHQRLVTRTIGKLNTQTLSRVIDAVIGMLLPRAS